MLYENIKKTQLGFHIKTTSVERDILNEVVHANLEEELSSCQYSLVDCEVERATHEVFNYAMQTFSAITVAEMLHHFYNNLKCAAKMN